MHSTQDFDVISLDMPCSAAMPREFQEGTSWRAMFAPVRSTMFAFSEQANLRFRLAEICFLGSFFAARQRMNANTGTDQRATRSSYFYGKNFANKILRQRVTEHPTSTE